VRPEEDFPVLASTLQRGSDCHREAVQGPLGEIFVLLERRRNSEPEAEQRVKRKRVSISQTTTDETVRGDAVIE